MIPFIDLKAGDVLLDFTVRGVTPLEEQRLTAVELFHPASGARLLHLVTDDPENLFSISFPTPPGDSMGAPHILEHAVLSGSRDFPVRDPFFEMLKMSMATFINAMTGNDCTYYPVCSNVKQDLFNLAAVYFDAVFHPLLTEDTFKREGHHLAPADPLHPRGPLTINGIVYNEMKSHYSTGEGRQHRLTEQHLFPDTIYGHDSGGDPERIPDLTWEGLRNFHARWYQPANGYFIFYGDIPTRSYLEFLAPRLAPFRARPAGPVVARQTRWSAPRQRIETYSIGPEEDAAEKTFLSMNWLVASGTDAHDLALLRLLSSILAGHDGAPLKIALIESGLGQDLLYAGSTGIGSETVFGVALKGSEPERAEAFRTLVFATLADIAAGDIDAELVTAAFRHYAYDSLEIRSLQPLHALQAVLEAWIYGADPLTFLRQNELLEGCRAAYASEPRIFQRLIRERLLANPHRLELTLVPDRAGQTRVDAAFAERLRQRRADLSDEACERIAAEAERLQAAAGVPNSPAALATLPQMRLADLPDAPDHIPTQIEKTDGLTFLRNDVFSNGVNYLHLDIDLTGLPAELWPMLPRYIETIEKLGAAGQDYEQTARRAALQTGGIGCYSHLGLHGTDPRVNVRGMRFTLKALDEQIDPALEVLRDLIFACEPRDGERFRDVIAQSLAGIRSDLVNQGSSTAVHHAGRGLSEDGYIVDITGGLPQLDLIEELHADFDRRAEAMFGAVEAIAGFLRNRARLTASFTGSDHAAGRVRAALRAWQDDMTAGPIIACATGYAPFPDVPREGLAAPLQVAHCAQVIPAPHLSHPDAPLLGLAMQMLRVDYIVSELRFKGNAYGANCSYDGSAIVLSTHADPHIKRTLDVFAALAQYVRAVPWTETEVHRGIISTAKNSLQPIRPSAATGMALTRHLTGHTPQVRQRRYTALLGATAGEVKRALLDVLDANFERAPIAIVSSRERLAQANRELGDRPLAIRDILRPGAAVAPEEWPADE